MRRHLNGSVIRVGRTTGHVSFSFYRGAIVGDALVGHSDRATTATTPFQSGKVVWRDHAAVLTNRQSPARAARMQTMTLKNSIKLTHRSATAIPDRLLARLRPPSAFRLSEIRSRWRMSREKRLPNWTFSSGEGMDCREMRRKEERRQNQAELMDDCVKNAQGCIFGLSTRLFADKIKFKKLKLITMLD